ncbi:major capsid protein, partial [Acinetobacter sp. F_3_1]
MEQQKQALQTQASHFKNNARRYGLGVAVAGTVGASNAAPIDTTAVVGTITDGVTTVSAIGLAVLS